MSLKCMIAHNRQTLRRTMWLHLIGEKLKGSLCLSLQKNIKPFLLLLSYLFHSFNLCTSIFPEITHKPFIFLFEIGIEKKLQTSYFLHILSVTMASSSSEASHVVVARLDVPLQKGNQSFTPDPSIEVKHAKIWNSHVLVPFSISNNMHAFLGPFPKLFHEHQKGKGSFP